MKKKHIVVIGVGNLGSSLAITVQGLGHEVLALDIDEKAIETIAPQITHAIQADATDETTLKKLGVGDFDVAIVTTQNIESNVLATILLKQLGVKYIIARASSTLHGSILKRIGANRIVYPEQEMGVMLAHVLTLGEVIDYIPISQGYGVNKVLAPPSFIDRTLTELGFGAKNKLGVAALLIQRNQEIIIEPSYTEIIRAGDEEILAESQQ
jgi:trk system potassium uptake protein TrkA